MDVSLPAGDGRSQNPDFQDYVPKSSDKLFQGSSNLLSSLLPPYCSYLAVLCRKKEKTPVRKRVKNAKESKKLGETSLGKVNVRLFTGPFGLR